MSEMLNLRYGPSLDYAKVDMRWKFILPNLDLARETGIEGIRWELEELVM
jgi:hypothetical protein